MSSSLVFNRVYRLEIQSVRRWYFRLQLLPLYLLSDLPPRPSPPSQSKHTVYADSLWLWGAGGVLSCVIDHILQKFNTLFLTRFRTYKIATPPHTKMTSKDDI
jgi:hypothetical protein